MRLEKIKRWQWLLIGGLLGLLVGAIALPGDDEAKDPVMRRPLTEHALSIALAEENGAEPAVTELEIHPTRDGKSLVVGQVWMEGKYFPFAVYTREPFVAADGQQYASVREYAEKLTQSGHRVVFRYQWWEQTWARLGISALVGMVVVGGVWPALMNILIGAGFGRPVVEEEYDLDRFTSENAAKDKPAETPDHSAVAAAVGRMEEKLGDAGVSKTEGAPADAPAAPAIAQLKGGPVELAGEPTAQEKKDYRGEFYPVAKPTGHDGNSPEKHGFTLVELLVVIGIIGVLMSMLLPAMARARRSANVLKCANNMRQIYLGLQSYLIENSYMTFWRGSNINTEGMDWYAYGGRETGNANLELNNYFNHWIPRPLNHYVANKVEIFHCPNDDLAPWTFDPMLSQYPAPTQFDWVGNSYNFNANGYPLRPLPRHDQGLDGVRYSAIRDSSNTILLYEACLYWGYDWHYGHKGNVAFADGHVVFIPFPAQEGEYHWNP
jgi:prepilin-type N-terminal cleavage/methylation domain-containing protein/prepilin-type processing-associated H-X9-DG protein